MFKYNDVFDTKGAVKSFLEANKGSLKDYIDNYERLLSESSLYRSVDGFFFLSIKLLNCCKMFLMGTFLASNIK